MRYPGRSRVMGRRTSTKGSSTMPRFAARLMLAAALLLPAWSMAAQTVQVCDVAITASPQPAASAVAGSNSGIRLAGTNPSYEVGCANKQSTCLVSDQLTVTPKLKNAAGTDLQTLPIQRVCLHLIPAGRSGATTAWEQKDWRWVRQDVSSELLQPVTLNIAAIVRRWLDDAQAKEQLSKNASAKQLIQVSVVTASATKAGDGVATTTEHLIPYEVELDLASLWQDGTLPLTIESAECSPCALGTSLKLKAPQLATWMAATKTPQDKLTLFIDGVRMAGLEPAVNKADGSVQFQLKRHLASAKDLDAAWTNALPGVLKNGSISFALGDDKSALTKELARPGAFGLSAVVSGLGTVGQGLAAMGAIAAVAGILAVLWFARKRKFLRDAYDIPDYPWPPEHRPFSLGRSQMAWWTLVVLLSAAVIFWRTGDVWSINLSALTLMGIGGATLVGSVAQGPPGRLTKLMDDYRTALAKSPPATSDIDILKAQLKSKNWLQDVLSEYGDDATAVHRLQNVLFTVVFGAVFVWLACSEGSMPELPAAILGLLGISGGVYVGYKWRT
jgi:hypothetical protein